MRLIAILRSAALAAALLPAAAAAQQASGEAFVRIQQLEEEIRRLNGRIEQLEHQLRQISDDAVRRLGDLEFRITELEGGDTSLVSDPAPLGVKPDPGPAVAVSERSALDEAVAAAQEGRLGEAEAGLRDFLAAYGDGPLAGEGRYWLGQTYFLRSDYREAAKSFLAVVRDHPESARAPHGLLRLAQSLDRLGQTPEACQTFSEIARRYPGAEAQIAEALAEMDRLRCS